MPKNTTLAVVASKQWLEGKENRHPGNRSSLGESRITWTDNSSVHRCVCVWIRIEADEGTD